MEGLVFVWVLGIVLYCLGWVLAITFERRTALYAALAVLGVIVCALSVLAGTGHQLGMH
jgi:hypothetical protein